jgi:4'-phosphopantetheinyl transferase EntD
MINQEFNQFIGLIRHQLKSKFDHKSFTLETVNTDALKETWEFEDPTGHSISEEEKAIVKFITSTKRKKQFIAGRLAAKTALRKLDNSIDSTILRDKNRLPVFPNNFIGTITHCGNFAVASVLKKKKNTISSCDSTCSSSKPWEISRISSLGIDLENLQKTPSERIIDKISSRDEFDEFLKTFEKNAPMIPDCLDRRLLIIVLFSLKESSYKAFFSTLSKFKEKNFNCKPESFSLRDITFHKSFECQHSQLIDDTSQTAPTFYLEFSSFVAKNINCDEKKLLLRGYSAAFIKTPYVFTFAVSHTS